MLVLSLFPGIGLLDMAFEAEGFCVVRGPDLLWGGDVRRFHPTAGKFDGVIGGPPCQAFSQASGGTSPAANLIPEFERVTAEAAPAWFVMENVPQAPVPTVEGYAVHWQVIDNWADCGGEQHRERAFSFGTPDAVKLRLEWPAPPRMAYRFPTVTANGATYIGNGRSKADRSRPALKQAIRLQGLPADFLSEAPFTVAGALRAVGNGVPLPMGRAIARAVKRAVSQGTE